MRKPVPLYRIIFYGFISLLIFLTSCTGDCEMQQYTSVYIFIDYTDSLNFSYLKKNYKEDLTKKIIHRFSLSPCNGGKIKLVPITDVGSSEVRVSKYDFISASANSSTLPEDAEGFYGNTIMNFDTLMKREPVSLKRTYLYEPFCNEMNNLVSEPPGKKIVIFYSDMLENSDGDAMMYGKKLDTAVIVKWEKQFSCRLGDLSGIDFYIVDQRESNTTLDIRNSVNFWTALLKSKGAVKVKNASTLDID